MNDLIGRLANLGNLSLPTLLVVALLAGLIPACIAFARGQNFLLWWLLGTFIFVLALPLSFFARKNDDLAERRRGDRPWLALVVLAALFTLPKLILTAPMTCDQPGVLQSVTNIVKTRMYEGAKSADLHLITTNQDLSDGVRCTTSAVITKADNSTEYQDIDYAAFLTGRARGEFNVVVNPRR